MKSDDRKRSVVGCALAKHERKSVESSLRSREGENSHISSISLFFSLLSPPLLFRSTGPCSGTTDAGRIFPPHRRTFFWKVVFLSIVEPIGFRNTVFSSPELLSRNFPLMRGGSVKSPECLSLMVRLSSVFSVAQSSRKERSSGRKRLSSKPLPYRRPGFSADSISIA